MTVLETIRRSTEFLAARGVDSPRLQSECLLAHVLQLPRMQLYLSFQRALTNHELTTARDLVQRRGKREPLQHLLGSVSFCGLDLRVSRQALIPRPETEQLVEHAITILEHSHVSNPKVLDFGTGSGCIAIALAIRFPTARLTACDISEGALQLASSNAVAHRVEDRIQFLQGDKFKALPEAAQFELIVSNPPYIPTAEIDQLQPEVKDHDPRVALDGGVDGLDFQRLLAAEASAWLNPTGTLMLECGDDQASAIQTLLTAENWIVEPPRPDYSGRERFLIARPSHHESVQQT